MWELRCYDPGTSGGFRSWFEGLPPEVQAAIEATLELLVHRPSLDGSVAFKELRGACEGLSEVRIEVSPPEPSEADQGRSFRILAFQGPGRRELTLLSGFEKVTGSEYSRECPKALKRKEGVLKDDSRAPTFEFP